MSLSRSATVKYSRFPSVANSARGDGRAESRSAPGVAACPPSPGSPRCSPGLPRPAPCSRCRPIGRPLGEERLARGRGSRCRSGAGARRPRGDHPQPGIRTYTIARPVGRPAGLLAALGRELAGRAPAPRPPRAPQCRARIFRSGRSGTPDGGRPAPSRGTAGWRSRARPRPAARRPPASRTAGGGPGGTRNRRSPARRATMRA